MSVADYSENTSAAANPDVHHDLPHGIIIGGPLVRAKRTESYVLFGIFVVGSIAGLTWAFTQGLGIVEWSLFVIMYSVTTIGIGVTVHRMLVHRSFRCNAVVKFFLCAIGQMACQGSLLKWVGNHRRHHLYADHVGDPHSPYLDGKGIAFSTKLKGWLHANNGFLFDETTETADLVKGLNRRIYTAEVDARDYDALKAAVDSGVEQLGRFDIIVANAGIGNGGATLDKTSERDWTDMIDVNLGGVWKTVKAGVPHILTGGTRRVDHPDQLGRRAQGLPSHGPLRGRETRRRGSHADLRRRVGCPEHPRELSAPRPM